MPTQQKSLSTRLTCAVKNVIMRQSGCQSHEDGYVMIDSGASVNVCSMWFGEAADEQSDSSVTPRRGWTNTPGKRQIWLRNGNHLKRHEFHVVDGTRSVLGASYLFEKRVEPHLTNQHFLKHVERHEPLVKKSGVYFVKAQIVHGAKGAVEAVMQEKSQQHSCV